MNRRDGDRPDDKEERKREQRERMQAERERHLLRRELHVRQHLERVIRDRERHLERHMQRHLERHIGPFPPGRPPYPWHSYEGGPLRPDPAARKGMPEGHYDPELKLGRRERIRGGIRMLLFMAAVLLILCACWTLAYYVTNWAYGKWDWYPHAIVRSVANSVLGFVIFGGIMACISPFIRKRQVAFLNMMLDAMKRISRGDFRIHITVPRGASEEYFSTLAMSINSMAKDLERLENMRQEFISNVSHEIQSPLTSIGGFARILKNEEVDREQLQHYAGIIEQESLRLSKLSENMLRLASLDSDQHPFHPEPYRLDKQLQSLIVACEPQWLEKGLEMNVEVEALTVEADPELLSQVWVNLLHNAIKFTPEGGSITVGLELAEDTAVVRITDTGIGIAEEDQPFIFQRFFKADKSRNRSAGGSGLGLSIIHKIVEMHRGTIQVSSKEGEGTQMTITLPLRNENAKADSPR